MEPIYVVATAFIAAVIASVGIVLLTRRAPPGGFGDAKISQLEIEVSALREAKASLERRLAVEEQRSLRLPALEEALNDRTNVADSLREAKTSVELELAKATEALSQIKEMRDHGVVLAEAAEVRRREAAQRFDVLRDEKAKLDETLAAKNEAILQAESTIRDLRQRLVATEDSRNEAVVRLDTMKQEKADQEKIAAEKTAYLDEKTNALEKMRIELEHVAAALRAAQKDTDELRTSEARLQETLGQEKKHSEAKLALLNEARERMSQEFKVLAEEVMKNHGDTFSKQNREQIDGLLAPLKEKIVEFQQGLQNAHSESVKERATLGEQIRNLTAESDKMISETANLTRALKGKGQTQGAWGEMILATILERSGLREGEEYITQKSHSSEDGTRLRPDVVINLPGGQRIVVDSKVSLTAFESYVNAESDESRAVHLKAHLTSLRGHIKALSSKEYHTLTDDGLDYVIMFVPIEGALAAALQEDPALTGFAAGNNVAIATPTTLMIALRTVANVWQVERRNRNAEAIAKRAGTLYDKFVGFDGDMRGLGTRLKQATESYEAAMNKLSTGRGNIASQVEQLKDMGAKTSKSLPKQLIDEEEPKPLSAPEPALV
jgi:DNA recombination protein RmuC